MVKANNQFMTKTRKAAERKVAAPSKPKVTASPEKKAPAKTMKSATTSAFQSSSSKTSRRAKKKIGKVKRIMKNREPKLLENDKNMMFLRGTKASQVIQDVMKELCQLKGELGKSLTRKNEIRPFEDASSLEFLSEKNDASLFAFGSHSKKRPNNLVLGRTFDHKILDMMELTVSNFVSMNEFNTSIIAGSKPTFIFKGTLFENDDTFINVKNLLLDTFRGKKYDQVSLNGIEWVICVSVDDETKKIHFRPYCIQLKNSGTRVSINCSYSLLISQ
jgi:ribosome production factor 2